MGDDLMCFYNRIWIFIRELIFTDLQTQISGRPTKFSILMHSRAQGIVTEFNTEESDNDSSGGMSNEFFCFSLQTFW
jgi:hypothetical protein